MIEFDFKKYLLKNGIIKNDGYYHICNLCNYLIVYNRANNINYMVNNHFKLNHFDKYKEIELKIARFDSLDLW